MDSAIFQTIQSVGIVGGLMFAASGLFFTAYEVRQRRKQDRFDHYVRFLSTYAESIKLLVERPDLHALYEYSSEDCLKTYKELTPEEKSRAHYCDLLIALSEMVWLATEKNLVEKDEWEYWRSWLIDLQGSRDFRWTLKWTQRDYAEEFIAELDPSR